MEACSNNKIALITGITGQDGSYLAELLLSKGYEVHGIIRRASNFNTQRIDHIFDQLHLHHGDMTDGGNLRRIVRLCLPDEVYNLAAQSHVKVSFDCPEYTMDVVATGTLKLLEAVRDLLPAPRFYQASSSEMYGNTAGVQKECSPFNPVSPYGVAKLAAHHTAQIYRDAYGVPVSCGILFNHESPRRGKTFVTSKVCGAAARIHAGSKEKLVLGNLDASRDWGYAEDYVEAMWLMLQQDTPNDFVIASGVTHTVRELCQEAFGLLGLDWKEWVTEDRRLRRPLEVPYLLGDSSKAQTILGWKPKMSFKGLIGLMVRKEQEAL